MSAAPRLINTLISVEAIYDQWGAQLLPRTFVWDGDVVRLHDVKMSGISRVGWMICVHYFAWSNGSRYRMKLTRTPANGP